jgi:hypothetical protein
MTHVYGPSNQPVPLSKMPKSALKKMSAAQRSYTEHYTYDEFVRKFGEEPSDRPEEEEKPHKHAHGRRKYR